MILIGKEIFLSCKSLHSYQNQYIEQKKPAMKAGFLEGLLKIKRLLTITIFIYCLKVVVAHHQQSTRLYGCWHDRLQCHWCQ